MCVQSALHLNKNGPRTILPQQIIFMIFMWKCVMPNTPKTLAVNTGKKLLLCIAKHYTMKAYG
jgi:hypothetical protein